MPATVGCVPYANAAPLVWGLRSDPEIDLLFDVPSRLPALLESGRADAVLVSSVAALQTGKRVAGGVCIGSFGKVESVKLISRMPLAEVRSVALDQSSMTSNLLAQIVLRQAGAEFSAEAQPPAPELMLANHDACVVIGDIGMTAAVDGALVTDLGEAWTSSTGLPFVWAMWTGNERLTSDLAEKLSGSYSAVKSSPGSWQQMVASVENEVNWPAGEVARYLSDCVRFELDGAAWQGYCSFVDQLRQYRLLEDPSLPKVVGGPPNSV